jgi:hypothetical protein
MTCAQYLPQVGQFRSGQRADRACRPQLEPGEREGTVVLYGQQLRATNQAAWRLNWTS